MFLDMYFQIYIDTYIYIYIYIYIYKYNLCLYTNSINYTIILYNTIYILYNYNVFVSTKMYLLRKLCICNCIYYDFF